MRSPDIPTPAIDPSAIISPGAHIYGAVTIGARSFILFGAVIRAELDVIRIGRETNVQDNVVIHCDEDTPTLIGDRVTIGHSAVVHGATIGDGALVAIGAKALNRSIVGEGAWLAAGAVLSEGKEVPPFTLAIGTPARPIRDLTDEEVRRANEGVDHYLELATAYKTIFAEGR